MPSPAACWDCMMDDGLPPEPKPSVTVEAVFEARYDGHCSGCNLPINVGQMIAKLSDGRYMHHRCSPDRAF